MTFYIGTIPVRLHASFFVMAVLLGAAGVPEPMAIAAFAVCVFGSVLLHEFGHALVGRAFGLTPRIDLHGMGGTTSWTAGKNPGVGGRILISLAGPGAGILAGVALFYLERAGVVHPKGALGLEVVRDLLWINVGWSILNLLPMLPLDGGNVLLALLNLFTRGRGERPARIVSILLAAGFGVLAVVYGGTGAPWYVLLCASFAFSNARVLRHYSRFEHDRPLREELERGYDALNRGEHAAAFRSGEAILTAARTPEVKADAMRLMGFAHFFGRNWEALLSLFDRGLSNVLQREEFAEFERVAQDSGRGDVAIAMRAATHAKHEARGGRTPDDFRSTSRR